MESLKYKTRGNSNPQGKPRVYFCCHKDDFEKFFESISDEVLSLQNCAVWYKDGSDYVNEELLDDLKRMQLFVMPVTTNLLCTENDALDSEFMFAIENHIPVLPLMQEPGLEQMFNQKCGELQFLDKNNVDATAISYEEKLKKYLESVLIGDEMAEKIRAAFDAYVFLSYRKKDRKYAQELMRLIHKNEFCRDIAIWYDEFLTPGENFNDSIKDAIQKSGLFVLTVTPNLVNEVNYIMTTEYPMAKQEGKTILPAELVPTDREELSHKYDDIPPIADAHNDSELSEALLESIKKMAIKKIDKNPEHNFFIGLAYLSGVDVEVDHEKALSLITSAAEAGLPEAMEKLQEMYYFGIGVEINYLKYLEYSQITEKTYLDIYGEKHSKSLDAKRSLALAYTELGQFNEAIEIYESIIGRHSEVFGSTSDEHIKLLNNMAFVYNKSGEYAKAYEILHPLYVFLINNVGVEFEATSSILSGLIFSYYGMGDFEKSRELSYDLYNLECQVSGEKSIEAIMALGNIAVIYSELEDFAFANRISREVYKKSSELFGEKNVYTITALNNYALNLLNNGQHKTALEQFQTVYKYRKSILGEDHPDTIQTLNNIALSYKKINNYNIAIELYKKAYNLFAKVLGNNHPDTLLVLCNLADTYNAINDFEKALDLFDKVYNLRNEILGKYHPHTFESLKKLAFQYGKIGDYANSYRMFKELYINEVKKFGESHSLVRETRKLLILSTCIIEKYDEVELLLIIEYDCTNNPKDSNTPNVIYELYNLVSAHLEHRNYSKGLSILELLVRVLTKIEGETSLITIETKLYLAEILILMENNIASLNICFEIYPYISILNETSRNKLADIFEKNGKKEIAFKIKNLI